MKRLSPRSIDFLAVTITGGAWPPDEATPWPYRPGWKIEKFFRQCNYDYSLNGSSRVPWTESVLQDINTKEGVDGVKKIVEYLLDPRDWVGNEEKHALLISELNDYLFHDGYEVVYEASLRRYVMRELGGEPVMLREAHKSYFFKPAALEKEFERILGSIETDPPDAVTSACSLVESVCKHILDRLGLPHPSQKTISHLVKSVMEHLRILPEGQTDEGFRRLVGGLRTVVHEIGNMRNEFGDAHGHTDGPQHLTRTHAKLAVGSAATIATFLVETFETQMPREEARGPGPDTIVQGIRAKDITF
ncbi:hypothetical protein A3F28_03000 [Candidatus Uhrbacteria bacterium RIFCSPHIGHO2_12_FULL_57_11]|uniref:Abortive infection protein-like C-terminal domain-containing protein n=3 Tax=Parcubacteria group TaxID=1794811 RepID=A0A1F7UI85_9BACT|nr:MAG: hypothetical protein A2704_04720 [Candidatus Kaiserbacteria bacterium RIFCSPHIGHO2_01_FULL_54_36b]OGL73049.1 MAG: hypothetical protein A3D72_02405 [Candidatus Uhrbacteria bacterium RIFCSPHIGHO2_02_FULL_57_19]OGL78010.1 MAG: hypothetical protein A3F28_03000 [Candidatus Uhrbacteria bacterium RIFCSPHIGHO2_12_FULL_57_11]